MLVKINIDNQIISTDLLKSEFEKETIISDIYNICYENFPNNNWTDLNCDSITYNSDYIEVFVSNSK
jgi:hypothetical protein